jgi:hypothetical protein
LSSWIFVSFLPLPVLLFVVVTVALFLLSSLSSLFLYFLCHPCHSCSFLIHCLSFCFIVIMDFCVLAAAAAFAIMLPLLQSWKMEKYQEQRKERQ